MSESMSANMDVNTAANSENRANTGADNTAVHFDAILRPLVDIKEDTAGITLLADLPGVDSAQLKIEVDGDTLLIEGTPDPHLTGQGSVQYRRRFNLSRELDSGAINATLKQGELTLFIPKRAEALPRRIEVRAA